MRRSGDFSKKCVFGGEQGQDPEQSTDLETRMKMPRGAPKTIIQSKYPSPGIPNFGWRAAAPRPIADARPMTLINVQLTKNRQPTTRTLCGGAAQEHTFTHFHFFSNFFFHFFLQVHNLTNRLWAPLASSKYSINTFLAQKVMLSREARVHTDSLTTIIFFEQNVFYPKSRKQVRLSPSDVCST